MTAIYRKKGEGFSLFLMLRTMTAIDISTKICKTNFGARCLSSCSDGKPLATNAWECPMLEVAAGG